MGNYTLNDLPKFKKGEMPSNCQFIGCSSKSHCRGLCEKHYSRYKNGRVYNIRNVQSGNDIELFLKKIEKQENGCWIWQAGTQKNSKGVKYGKHHADNGKTVTAHRFSYSKFIGAIPDGMYVCHKCDTPLCVNPEHLFIGSHKDNMDDMVRKNRLYKAYGENMHSSKLTNEQAKAIRDSDDNCKSLAIKNNVSVTTIKRIKIKETYKNA